METIPKKEILLKTPLFANLSNSQAEEVALLCKEKHYQKGGVLIEQDDLSDELFIISLGTVKIYRLSDDGEEINLSVRSAGDVIGEMAFLEQKPRSAYAEVISEGARVLVLERSDFENVIQKYPAVALMMMRELASRIRMANEHLEDVLSRNLHDRTHKTLVYLARYFQNGEIEMSQEELAEIIGATRARVTEVLNNLQDEGAITLSHKMIKLNP